MTSPPAPTQRTRYDPQALTQTHLDLIGWHVGRYRMGAADYDATLVLETYPDCPIGNGHTHEDLKTWLDDHPEVKNAEARVDPEGPPPQPKPEPKPELLEIPSIPREARLAPEIGADACPWLDQYIEFSRQWSPRSFDGFHEATALWVLSTTAARRVRFHFGKPRYTNLYLMLAGRTTVHAKSSATEIGKQVLQKAGLEFLLASDQATPQAFLSALSRKELPPNYDHLNDELKAWARFRIAFNAQRGWYFEEFGSGIEAMMRKSGVMADFRGILRAFDDCPGIYARDTISRGLERVERPYLALIGNLTPADLRPVASRGSQLWGDGFLARFAFITPPADEIKRGRFPKGERVIPPDLIQPIVDWHKRLGWPDLKISDQLDHEGNPTGEKEIETGPIPTQTLALSDEVINAYYAYDHALLEIAQANGSEDLDGNYGRLGEKALRVAALFASLAGSDVIALPHFAKAQSTVERWRLYTHRIYDQVTTQTPSDRRHLEDNALEALKRWQGTEKYPDGMTAAEVARFVRGCATGDMTILLDGLERGGALEKHKPQRAERYYIPGVNELGTVDKLPQK